MANPFAPAQVDFSMLANLPNIYAQGQEVGRQRDLRNAFSDGLPMRDGVPDWDTITATIAKHDPIAGAKIAADRAGAETMANFRMQSLMPPDLRPFAGGGAAPAGEFGNAPVGAPPPVSGVASPGGSTAPAGGIPAKLDPYVRSGADIAADEERAKATVQNQEKLRMSQPTDRAFVESVDDKFERLDRAVQEFVDQKGRPTDATNAISGTVKFGEFDTNIPKAYVPNISTEARNASRKLETVVYQVGLGALAEMRAAAASGASGLGQLAIQESIMLQNSIANLQEAQSPDELAQAMKEVQHWTRQVRSRVRDKYRSTYGEDLGERAPAPSENELQEGETVFDPDGKPFVVRGGQFVPAQM